MGLGTVLMDYFSGLSNHSAVTVILYGTTCGLIGSLADSVLGAILQVTYLDPQTKKVHHEMHAGFKHISGFNIFTNVQVNFVSICFTVALGGWVIGPAMFTSGLPVSVS